MAKTYIGVNGVAKKLIRAYLGVNGVAKKIRKVYIGDANGVARLGWTIIEAGQIVFTSSTTWTAPFTGTIEVFCVGGGSAGTGSYRDTIEYSGGETERVWRCGGGGGGGYTKTATLQITEGETFNVIIGAGGTLGTSNPTGAENRTYNVRGGYSAFGDIKAAAASYNDQDMSNDFSSSVDGRLGLYAATHGGSRGGRGYLVYDETPGHSATNGGSDGSGGQGTTTRAFGDPNGTLYSGGGGGGNQSYPTSTSVTTPTSGGAGGGGNGGGYIGIGTDPVSGTANTGGGAGGYGYNSSVNASISSSIRGGTGVVIIRWSDQ